MGWKSIIGGVAVVAMTAVAMPASAAPPANDDIADAVPLTEGVEKRLSTVDATSEPSEDYCDGENTVWFSFTAPSAGDYVAYATGSDHDTEVGWNDTIDNNTGVCNDDADDSYDAVEELRTFGSGEQEYVQMGVNSTGYVGTGGVGVTRVVPAADAFGSATTLSRRSGAQTAVIGIEFAGTETSQPAESVACGTETLDADSAWLDFTAPASGSWMIEAKSYSDIDLAVYKGTSVSSLSLLHCATSGHNAAIVDVTAGTTYRIRVSGGATDPVVVRAEAAPTPMTASLVDTDGDGTSSDVGQASDMTLVDGRPAIAYHDQGNRELRYASQAANGTWTDVLIDADGDGTSTNVGDELSMAVLPNGQPAVAYYDGGNDELRYASRAANGTWTDVLVDADGDGTSNDVGLHVSMIVQANGQPAVAYYDGDNDELRLASRAANGTWTDSLIDADGDGTSIDVGEDPGLVQFANGDLGVSYIDDGNDEIRFARRTGSGWSDQTVHSDPENFNYRGAGTVLDSAGRPVIGATNTSVGNHLLAWWNGSGWDIEHDHADRHVAELDFDCARPELMIDDLDVVHLLWTDCNYAYTPAMSVRQTDGTWSAHDVVPYLYSPTSSDFVGDSSLADMETLGATWLADGRLAVSVMHDDDESLWYAEEALKAEAGHDTGSATATTATLDGTGSSDDWGSIVSYAWSGAPAGCTLTDATKATAAISCDDDTTGTVTLTVTDTDGFTHRDTVGFQVAAPDPMCDPTPDPFTDVPATSFARADVTCIYNLGVTTGTTATTYSPGLDVTREQMAAFLARLYKSMTGSDAPIVATPFTDVPATSFAKDSVARIYGLGITTGTTATTYSPDDVVTREQMAAFLARLYKAAEGADAPIVATPFTDVADTSFAKDSVARIYGLGITTGTTATTYSPADPVTREQMASFLARLFRAG